MLMATELISRNAVRRCKRSSRGLRRTHTSVAGFKLVAKRSIAVVAADQGLRRSVAFALEVEGHSTDSYDSLQKAEASWREALCEIVDDDILRSEPQAARNSLAIGGPGHTAGRWPVGPSATRVLHDIDEAVHRCRPARRDQLPDRGG